MKNYDITKPTERELEQERLDAIAERNDEWAWEDVDEMRKDYKLVYSALNEIMQDEKLLERICKAYIEEKTYHIGIHVESAIDVELHKDALKEIESEQNI